jgi:hypothetical protein
MSVALGFNTEAEASIVPMKSSAAPRISKRRTSMPNCSNWEILSRQFMVFPR